MTQIEFTNDQSEQLQAIGDAAEKVKGTKRTMTETEEQRQRKRERELQRYHARTPEEKAQLAAQRRERYAKLTPEQKAKAKASHDKWREENKERVAEYNKTYKATHKDEVAAQQAAWNEANRDKRREYDRQRRATPEFKERRAGYHKDYYAANQDTIKERARQYNNEHYEENKQRMKEAAEMVGASEAATMLGMTRTGVIGWLKSGILAGTQAPGGRKQWLIRRADVEALRQVQQPDGLSGKVLKAVRKVGEFEVPSNFDLITTYQELSEYTAAFAQKKIGFLLLVGSPGSGKSRQMRSELEGRRVTWIDNHVTNLGLYCAVYDAKGQPVVLDDVNHFLGNKLACSLLKALTQTEEEKSISWESPVKYLEEREVPRSYKTKSPVCMIANLWDASNADMAAIQDRALPVAFFPSAETIHERVLQLGWCQDKDITDFIGENLARIPQPSMREYYTAGAYKRAGMDWRKKLMGVWGVDTLSTSCSSTTDTGKQTPPRSGD